MADKCEIYEDLLVQEALGDTSEKERAFLKAHLASCAECRAVLAGLADTVGLLKRERPETAPAGLAERTVRRIEHTGHRFVVAASPYHETRLLEPGSWRIRKSLVGWMIAAAVLVMFTASLVPGMMSSDGSRGIQSCQENMRMIATALRQYARDNGGMYPQGPEWYMALDYQYLQRANALLCPGRIAVGAPAANRVDYMYNPTRTSINSGDDYPILWDKKGAHDRLGRNVTFADGRVGWLEEDAFEKLLVRYKINEADIPHKN